MRLVCFALVDRVDAVWLVLVSVEMVVVFCRHLFFFLVVV